MCYVQRFEPPGWLFIIIISTSSSIVVVVVVLESVTGSENTCEWAPDSRCKKAGGRVT